MLTVRLHRRELRNFRKNQPFLVRLVNRDLAWLNNRFFFRFDNRSKHAHLFDVINGNLRSTLVAVALLALLPRETRRCNHQRRHDLQYKHQATFSAESAGKFRTPSSASNRPATSWLARFAWSPDRRCASAPSPAATALAIAACSSQIDGR